MKRLIHPRFETLVRSAQGELDDKTKRRAADHLALCPRCRVVVAGVRQVGEAARTIEAPAPPAGMRERVLAEREAGERALLPSTAPVNPKPRAVRPGFAAAAALLVAAGVSWVARVTTEWHQSRSRRLYERVKDPNLACGDRHRVG